jgi:hypothetical protein
MWVVGDYVCMLHYVTVRACNGDAAIPEEHGMIQDLPASSRLNTRIHIAVVVGGRAT